MPSRLTFRRTEADTATDVGYVLPGGALAAIRVDDTSDAQTIAGQLRALAARIDPAGSEPRVTPKGRRRRGPL